MKKQLLLAVAVVLTTGAAQAQKLAAAQVPAAATATFKKMFPTAKGAKWEKEGADYEVNFAIIRVQTSAVITAAGMLKETEEGILIAELPEGIHKAIAAKYKGYKIIEAAKIVTAATGVTTYEAEISQAGKHHDVLFNADGTEVKK
jgi:hypothetical protein